MPQLTITEALAEIKTIGKRLEKKRTAVLQNLGRDARAKDPLAAEGGSVAYVAQERQGIADLEKRVVALRVAITKANLATTLTINDVTHSITEWLTWKRDVHAGAAQFLTNLNGTVLAIRQKAQKAGATRIVTAPEAADESKLGDGDVIINLNEKELLEQQERLEQVFGELDGKLSLLNATTVVDV
jgi:hypothetical protein